MSERAVFIESWTKANLFFRACSLKIKVKSEWWRKYSDPLLKKILDKI